MLAVLALCLARCRAATMFELVCTGFSLPVPSVPIKAPGLLAVFYKRAIAWPSGIQIAASFMR
jgi:hypothetical protein